MRQARWMKSLKTRLLIFSISTVFIILTGAAVGLPYLFEADVEQRVKEQLNNYIVRLIQTTTFSESNLVPSGHNLGSLRFDSPYSGLYWQINKGSVVLASSGSLMGFRLDVAGAAQGFQEYFIQGPKGNELLVDISHVVKKTELGTARFVFAVALDHEEVTISVNNFTLKLVMGLFALGSLLIVSTWFHITYGIRPLNNLSAQLSSIRDGQTTRIFSDRPLEILPLVEEINVLLEQQEAMMEKSRVRAGALAHGLKTPLAAIAAETRNLGSDSQSPQAIQILQHIDTMENHIRRELIRAKVRGSTHGIRSRTLVTPLLDGIIRTLRRLPKGAQIAWKVYLPKDMTLAIETDDLAEIMGNLLDNCRKHASQQVVVTSDTTSSGIALYFHDDGNGLKQTEMKEVLRRGISVNDNQANSGLGLTIVHDIIKECGGNIQLMASTLGGLCVRVEIPV